MGSLKRWHMRTGLIALAAVAALITLPAAAQATPTLQLTVASDPAESITTQLGANGTNDSTSGYVVLEMTVKPSGGLPCAANYEADNGTQVPNFGISVSNGPYSWSTNWTFSAAGSYLLCGWLEDHANNLNTVLAATSTTVSVRPPHLAVSISAPGTVQTGQIFQASTTAQAETSRNLFEYLIPNAGDGCPANAAAASAASNSQTVFGNGNSDEITVDGGPSTDVENQTFRSPGTYLYCAYFEYPNQDSPPEATASAPLSVVPPPPPCVVPKLAHDSPLATAEAQLTAAHCTVGPITSAASMTVKRGDAVRFSPASGTTLASGAAVAVVVSTGPPCVVPITAVGSTLKHTEHAIKAADCTAGTITHVHSRLIPRGFVVALNPRPGVHLPSGQPVAIEVSSGPRKRPHRA